MNVAIDYQYCDAGNWKQSGRVVVENREALELSVALQQMKSACEWASTFVASRVRFPDCFFEGGRNEDDMDCHELCDLRATDEPVTDPRSLSQVVRDFERCRAEGWWVGLLGE